MAQVSVNITDYEETSIHSVYEAVSQDAEVTYLLNPLPDDKILDWSKLKQMAEDILKYI